MRLQIRPFLKLKGTKNKTYFSKNNRRRQLPPIYKNLWLDIINIFLRDEISLDTKIKILGAFSIQSPAIEEFKKNAIKYYKNKEKAKILKQNNKLTEYILRDNKLFRGVLKTTFSEIFNIFLKNSQKGNKNNRVKRINLHKRFKKDEAINEVNNTCDTKRWLKSIINNSKKINQFAKAAENKLSKNSKPIPSGNFMNAFSDIKTNTEASEKLENPEKSYVQSLNSSRNTNSTNSRSIVNNN